MQYVSCSNRTASHFQSHGVRAYQQLPVPPVGRAVTAAESGAVSEAAFRAPAAPTKGTVLIIRCHN